MNMAFIRLKKEDDGNKNEAITLALRLEIVSCVGVWEKGGGKEKRRRPRWREGRIVNFAVCYCGELY